MDVDRERLGLALLRFFEGSLSEAELTREVLRIAPHDPEALKFDPRYAPALERLCEVFLEAGDMAQAEKYARRGLHSDPPSCPCLILLARIHTARGQMDDALAFLDQAIAIGRQQIEAAVLKGQILRRQLRVAEALEVLGGRMKPSEDLGELLTFLGRYEEALDVYWDLLSFHPASFELQIQVARLLYNAGRGEDAAGLWLYAEAGEPSPGITALAKATTLALAGDFPGAVESAEQSLERNPVQGKPYSVLFAAKRASAEDRPRLGQMEDLLRGAALRDSDRVDLHFALGKAYDNLGDYGQAISHCDEGNRLRRRLVLGDRPFDREGFRRTVDGQIEAFSRSALNGVGSDAEDQPIFVMGMLRSGTTLVDQILSCHSAVGSAGEVGFWLMHEPTAMKGPEEATRLKGYYDSLLQLLAPGCARVVDKNPANVLVAGLLHTLYPSSRILCTRRNAVDTALSIWMTPMDTRAEFVYDREDIVFAYREFLRLAAYWREAMPPRRYTEVNYEDLTANPEAETRRLLDFAGLEWQEACLHPEQKQSSVKVRQPIYRTSVDRWRHYEPWLGPFEELAGM